MSDTFGIRLSGNAEQDEFYVLKEKALWDWLIADNSHTDPSDASRVILAAPEGYRFYLYDSLVAEYALTPFDESSNIARFYADSVNINKFYSLMGNLHPVEAAQFESLGLDEYCTADILRPEEELFGVRWKNEEDGTTEHYIGYDRSVFDWIVADNVEPSDRENYYKVKAPDGYGFLYGNLTIQNDEDGWDDFEYVEISSPQKDKAEMVLEMLQFVEPSEFESEGVSEEYILDFILE